VPVLFQENEWSGHVYMRDRCIECASYYVVLNWIWTVPCPKLQSLTPIELD